MSSATCSRSRRSPCPTGAASGGREAALAGSGLRLALLATSLLAGLALALATISIGRPLALLAARRLNRAFTILLVSPYAAALLPPAAEWVGRLQGAIHDQPKSQVMAGATVLGLGALGGVALATNHGVPAHPNSCRLGGSGAVVTSASGAAAPRRPDIAVAHERRAPDPRSSLAPAAAPLRRGDRRLRGGLRELSPRA